MGPLFSKNSTIGDAKSPESQPPFPLFLLYLALAFSVVFIAIVEIAIYLIVRHSILRRNVKKSAENGLPAEDPKNYVLATESTEPSEGKVSNENVNTPTKETYSADGKPNANKHILIVPEEAGTVSKAVNTSVSSVMVSKNISIVPTTVAEKGYGRSEMKDDLHPHLLLRHSLAPRMPR
uniref:Col_cuticle_N domain-containing protein n=1 Tax=Steinernema glaseri TaxID=37863 RepID=A0A1I7ZQ70_9BILA